MDPIEVVVLGAPINNSNLGCQALTYSVISLLEQIANEQNIEFHFNIIEGIPNEESRDIFCKRMKISKKKLDCVQSGNYYDFLREIKHHFENVKMRNLIRRCSFVIDLTEGDSFTDIYGSGQFRSRTSIKMISEKYVPLILGSQTYGPFKDPSNEMMAADVIKKAVAVFTRDRISGNYVKKISGVEPILTCDLAFRLPYESHADEKNSRLKKVGLNISGLLVSDKKEASLTDFTLKTNYDEFIKQILDYLIAHQYEVHLIGHVAADYTVNKMLKEKYPSVILAPEFDNPMDAKSYISSMDLFIGSRMQKSR